MLGKVRRDFETPKEALEYYQESKAKKIKSLGKIKVLYGESEIDRIYDGKTGLAILKEAAANAERQKAIENLIHIQIALLSQEQEEMELLMLAATIA